MNFVIVISDNINTIPYYFPVVLNMPQYLQYTEIAKKFDILYCKLMLEPAYDQVQICLDFWALLTWIRRKCNSQGWFKFSLTPGSIELGSNHTCATGHEGSKPGIATFYIGSYCLSVWYKAQDSAVLMTFVRFRSKWYRSFETYRTRFSQDVSYIIQLRQKDSRENCVTL